MFLFAFRGKRQLVNKFNNLPFTKNDENFVEAFSIFCGMGISNTNMSVFSSFIPLLATLFVVWNGYFMWAIRIHQVWESYRGHGQAAGHAGGVELPRYRTCRRCHQIKGKKKTTNNKATMPFYFHENFMDSQSCWSAATEWFVTSQRYTILSWTSFFFGEHESHKTLCKLSMTTLASTWKNLRKRAGWLAVLELNIKLNGRLPDRMV